MSTEKSLSFEDVNSQIEQHLSLSKSQSVSAAAPDLCSIYGIVKPILTLLSQTVLIPQTWRGYITDLIQVLDTLCPGH